MIGLQEEFLSIKFFSQNSVPGGLLFIFPLKFIIKPDGFDSTRIYPDSALFN